MKYEDLTPEEKKENRKFIKKLKKNIQEEIDSQLIEELRKAAVKLKKDGLCESLIG